MQISGFRPTYDVLTLTSLMSRSGVELTPDGAHMFAYIASLLAVYAKQTDLWDYTFAATPAGAPHSSDLEAAMSKLFAKAALEQSGHSLKLTSLGKEELGALAGFSEAERRQPFLSGAADTVYFLPVGLIRTALAKEPGLATFGVRQQAGLLLQPGTTTDALIEQLDAVKKAVGTESKDMLVPAVGWLSYLATAQSND